MSNVDRWLSTYYNAGTRRQYRQALASLSSAAGDVLAVDLDEASQWIRSQRETLAPSTVQARLTAARAFYDWAVEEGLVTANPFRRIRRPGGSRLGRGRALTEQEARCLWTAIRQHSTKPTRDLALFETALFCGLRRSELASLRWRDIDITASTMTVRGKGDREREMALPRRVVEALTTWRTSLNGAGGPSQSVFGLSGSGIYALVVRRVEDAGIEHASPHDLRRTLATRLLDAGVPLERVQDTLGHAWPQTTRRYDRENRALSAAAGDALDWDL